MEGDGRRCPNLKFLLMMLNSDLGLKLTPQDADTIKQEIRKLSALRGTTADQRLKQSLLKPFWSASVDEALAQVSLSARAMNHSLKEVLRPQSESLQQMSPPIRLSKGDVFEDRETSQQMASGDGSVALLRDFSGVKPLAGPGFPTARQDKVEIGGLRDVHTPPPRNLLEMVGPASSGDRDSRYFTCLGTGWQCRV